MEQKFFDRHHELSLLRRYYGESCKGRGSLVALYGRRRVGKTELVKQFLDKIETRKLYFYVDLAERKVILDSLQKNIQEQLQKTVIFNDFADFFTFIRSQTDDSPFVLVIDEFQRFLDVAPEAITLLQKNWDEGLKLSKIMIIIVGSSIGMMQKITGSKAGALYGSNAVDFILVKSSISFNISLPEEMDCRIELYLA